MQKYCFFLIYAILLHFFLQIYVIFANLLPFRVKILVYKMCPKGKR